MLRRFAAKRTSFFSTTNCIFRPQPPISNAQKCTEGSVDFPLRAVELRSAFGRSYLCTRL